MRSLSFLLGAVSVGLLGLAGVYGGWFPVSANPAEPVFVKRLVHEAYESAVGRAADDIEVPDDLDKAERILRGVVPFEEMCSLCHIPPGEEASVQALGMNPPPPKLKELLQERTTAEAFWVLQHGVRMTGMPAFGPTHPDEALWDLVAFLQAAASLDSEGYEALQKQAKAKGLAQDGHSHSHGHMEAHHEAPSAMEAPVDLGAIPQTPEEVAAALQVALAQANRAKVESLLDPAVRIYESGGVEASLAEYAAHHMPADMTFMSQMHAKLLERKVSNQGDSAVVMSRSRLQGEYGGKERDLLSNETLVMHHGTAGWKITHIHWSSGNASEEH